MIIIFSENSFLYFWNIQKASYIFRIYKKPLISSEYTPLGGVRPGCLMTGRGELSKQQNRSDPN